MLVGSNLPYGVAVYGRVAPPELCDRLISHFARTPKTRMAERLNGAAPSFEHLDIDEGGVTSNPSLREVSIRVRRQIDRYLTEYIADPSFREQLKTGIYSMQPRMKRYRPGASFPLHSDDSSIAALSRRFAYILYLNDGFEGGETVFRSGQSEVGRIKPEQGALAVFPVHPVFMHEGAPVTSGDKYIWNGFVETITSQARSETTGFSRLDVVRTEIAMHAQRLMNAAEIIFGIK